MDDFYSEMKPFLNEPDTKTSIERTEPLSSSSSIFAEALIPMNPTKWVSYAAGIVTSSDMIDLSDKLGTPFNNIVVAKEYLETSKSDIQYRDRLWELIEDMTVINIGAELIDQEGAFISGAYVNECADKYVNKMIKTDSSLNIVEQFNEKIYKNEVLT